MEYCIKCNKDVDVIKNKESVEYHIHGNEVVVDVDVLRCAICNNEVSNAALFDLNTNLAKEAYIKKFNILTFDEINRLMTAKNINKDELCLKCNINNIIFKKYSKGKLLSKEDSDKIRMFLNK